MKPEKATDAPAGRKKPLAVLALLCVLCLLLTGCAKVKKLAGEMYFIWMIAHSDDHMTQSQIEKLILENKDALEEDILAGRAERWENKLGIQSVHVRAEGYVDFHCGGWGIVTSGGYSGFYYSPEDTPGTLYFTDGPLVPQDGGWTCQQNGNMFYTRRVTERFFWYEYHF